jgi:hypothetical protein
MTVTTFDTVRVRRGARSISAGAPWALRLRVRVIRGRLDRQIAAGRSCESGAALALRVRQLIHPRTRRRVACGLRGVVEYVDRVGLRRDYSAVVIERAAVRAGREAILGLAERFEGSAPVTARGVVLARALLTDGFSSPLFNRYCERTVAEAVWEVADSAGVGASQPGLMSSPFGPYRGGGKRYGRYWFDGG